MKYLIVLFTCILLSLNCGAQVKNSVSAGGGITYPLKGNNYDVSWFASLHWNIALGRSSVIDTQLNLAEIGVKNYPDAPNVENDFNIYQIGIGYRQYVVNHLFIRGGLSAAVIRDAEATARIFPNLGLGCDFPIADHNAIEVGLELLYLSRHEVKRITYLNRNYVTTKKSLPKGVQIDEC